MIGNLSTSAVGTSAASEPKAPTTMSGASVPAADRPLTAGDDWTEWHGGENPVPGQMVNWQTRNEPNRDDCETAVPSEALDWSHPPRQAGNPPIIAYRLSRPAASDEEVGADDGLFLLMKRGLYYRPNAMGYTGIKDHAGRYTEDEARCHADEASGVTAVRAVDAPDFSEACFDDLARAHLVKKLDEARLTIAALASPPVSERERELEGALRLEISAEDLAAVERVFLPSNPNKMRTAHPDTIRAAHAFKAAVARALTAQPAGEGK